MSIFFFFFSICIFINIIEKCVIGKVSTELCEDGFIVTDNFAAVIDGSTSKTAKQISSEMKNGRLCMELIKKYIETSLTANATCEDFCLGISDFISEVYKRNQIDIRHLLEHPEERITASAIIYSKARKEIWMIGDCQCLIDGKLYTNDKPRESTIASKRADLINKGDSPSDARKAIVPDIIQAMKEGQNITYAVIDGFPIFMQGVPIISVSDAHSIILASDGYPFLKDSLKESELLLANQLKNDPQNISHFKATKGLVEGCASFDDRCYLKISLT